MVIDAIYTRPFESLEMQACDCELTVVSRVDGCKSLRSKRTHSHINVVRDVRQEWLVN